MRQGGSFSISHPDFMALPGACNGSKFRFKHTFVIKRMLIVPLKFINMTSINNTAEDFAELNQLSSTFILYPNGNVNVKNTNKKKNLSPRKSTGL